MPDNRFDKIMYGLVGFGIDYSLFVLTESVTFLPLFAIAFLFVKLIIDDTIRWKLINMKSIRETTERIEPEQVEDEQVDTYIVNTRQGSYMMPRNDDKQLSGFLLKADDFDALSMYYATNDDKGFRRDDSANGRGAKSLCEGITSANFGLLRNALLTDGYIDERNNWTGQGFDWLNGRKIYMNS